MAPTTICMISVLIDIPRVTSIALTMTHITMPITKKGIPLFKYVITGKCECIYSVCTTKTITSASIVPINAPKTPNCGINTKLKIKFTIAPTMVEITYGLSCLLGIRY